LLNSVIRIYGVSYSPVKNVSVFDQMAELFESVLALCVHYHAVHHHWENDKDDDFALLYDIDL